MARSSRVWSGRCPPAPARHRRRTTPEPGTRTRPAFEPNTGRDLLQGDEEAGPVAREPRTTAALLLGLRGTARRGCCEWSWRRCSVSIVAAILVVGAIVPRGAVCA